MLRRLIALSLNNSGLVLLAALGLLVTAIVSLPSMPIDVFPELNAPTVVLLTEAGGLTAEEVEQQVSFPIETAMAGLPGVRRVRSASALGLSLVWVEFGWGAPPLQARQLVGERLGSVTERLPEGVHVELAPMTSITGEILLVSVRQRAAAPGPTDEPEKAEKPGSERMHRELELRAFAEFELRPYLMAVAGVSQVVAIGGRMPEHQVLARQEDLLRHGLHLNDLIGAASEAHSTQTAGYLPNVQGRELPISQRARVRRPSDIASTLLQSEDGAPVPISAVADVALGGAPRRGTAADAGFPAVVLSIQKSPGTNTLELTRAIDAALDQLASTLPPNVVLNGRAFRQADFIQRSMDHVSGALLDAVIIVTIILMLFLVNARAALITLTALPLSLAVGVLVLRSFDMSLNVMTLGGLAVAIGELVDDAVIDVENVIRRLRENSRAPKDQVKPYLQVLFDASNEIRSSVVFATLIICAVFLPLLQLQGLEGRFFQPLGFAYVIAVLASLVVALTVTPALCNVLLRSSFPHVGPASPQNGDESTPQAGPASHTGRFATWLLRRYAPLLDAALDRGKTILVAGGVATALALLLASSFGTSFLPTFSEGSLTVFLMAPPGTSLDESDRLARGVERRLVGLDGVAGVVRRTGRAERDVHAEPVWSSEIDVRLLPEASKLAVRRLVDTVLADVPGVQTMVGQPIEHRLSHILSGTPAALAINFYGEELPVLREVAHKAAAALRAVPGAREINANREALVRTLPVRYDRAALARFGLTPAAAAQQLSAAFAGAKVATVREGRREFDLVVRLQPDARARPQQLEKFILRGRDGQLVRLTDVATVAPDDASVVVARENAHRKAVVSCNVGDGYNLGHFVQAARKRIDPIAKAAGVTVHYGGQFEAERAARKTLMTWGLAALVLVSVLLRMALQSWGAAGLVLLNLPLALIGGVVAVYVAESPSLWGNALALLGLGEERYIAPVLSIASLIGFITLGGIAIRNGILLVNHFEALQADEGLDVDAAVRRGSAERLIPILMTALTAALGLVPLALAAGQPGSELLSPLAVVVLGGLLTSTALNLFVVPIAYRLSFGRATQRAATVKLVHRGGSYVVTGSSS